MTGGERLQAVMRARPVLLDGGMGTRLIAYLRSSSPEGAGRPPVSLTHPEIAGHIHALDVQAGSEVVLTNTFCANRPYLERWGLAREFEARNRRGVEIARKAAGSERFVLGSIGPITDPSAARWYGAQAEILADAGADALILETHTFEQAILALPGLTGGVRIPVFVSLWIWPDDASSAAKRLEDAGAAAMGTNCGKGLEDVLMATEKIAGAVSVPLLAKPSAGLFRPGVEMTDSPDDFAIAVPRFVALGVRLVGGCCGTDEQYVAAMRGALELLGDLRKTPPAGVMVPGSPP